MPPDEVRGGDPATVPAVGRGEDLRLDLTRMARTGTPEVVYGEGKTADQIIRALTGLCDVDGHAVLATRVDAAKARDVRRALPAVRYDPQGRVVVAREAIGDARIDGIVALAVAGTSDLTVACECRTVLEACGVTVEEYVDIGVAGAHRTVAVRDRLDAADVVVVVAGMEGALPTFVAGLVTPPVVAVPTSVGYGAAFEGVAALLGMLNSCAPGVGVVNIDGGFAAAFVALRHLRGLAAARQSP